MLFSSSNVLNAYLKLFWEVQSKDYLNIVKDCGREWNKYTSETVIVIVLWNFY